MSKYARPHDVEIEFTLSRKRKTTLDVGELRTLLIYDPVQKIGMSVIVDLEGLTPILPGETRRARALFFWPEGARAQFPEGAHFTSFEIEGTVLRWLTPLEVAAE